MGCRSIRTTFCTLSILVLFNNCLLPLHKNQTKLPWNVWSTPPGYLGDTTHSLGQHKSKMWEKLHCKLIYMKDLIDYMYLTCRERCKEMIEWSLENIHILSSVVKFKPEKKNQAWTELEPMTSATPGRVLPTETTEHLILEAALLVVISLQTWTTCSPHQKALRPMITAW